MKKEFNSASDVASYYTSLYQELEYPSYVKKPVRSDYSNHTDFGVAMDEYEKKEIERNELRSQYDQHTADLNDKFKKDLLKFLGVEKHKNANALWSLAWEHGHSSGYHEIAIYADEFAELLK